MRVSCSASFHDVVGCKDVEVRLAEGATVRDLLAELLERWPGLRAQMLDGEGTLARHVQIFLDGYGVRHLPEGHDCGESLRGRSPRPWPRSARMRAGRLGEHLKSGHR